EAGFLARFLDFFARTRLFVLVLGPSICSKDDESNCDDRLHTFLHGDSAAHHRPLRAARGRVRCHGAVAGASSARSRCANAGPRDGSNASTRLNRSSSRRKFGGSWNSRGPRRVPRTLVTSTKRATSSSTSLSRLS